MMVTDIDIWRAAHQMKKQYGSRVWQVHCDAELC